MRKILCKAIPVSKHHANEAYSWQQASALDAGRWLASRSGSFALKDQEAGVSRRTQGARAAWLRCPGAQSDGTSQQRGLAFIVAPSGLN
jgi:hypothetical protein